GKDRTDYELDLIALDERLDFGHGEVGLELIVGNDHLNLSAPELAIERLDRKIKSVAELLAKHRRRPGQGGNDADLEFLLRLRSSRPQNDCRGGEQDQSLHGHLL